jgi:chromosome segregation ATPase
MTDKSQEIEKQIEDTNAHLSTLKAELQEQSTRLAEKLAEQKAAILAGKPTGENDSEIASLQTKIPGTQAAIKFLEETLQRLQKDHADELRAIGGARAEEKKSESMQLASEIYSLLASCRPRLIDLKTKNAEYFAALKEAESGSVVNESRKMNDLVFFLERELPSIMAGFPSSIRGEEKFADRNKQSKSLRK